MNGDNLLKFLKEYWFVIVFIGSVIVTWTQFSTRITALEVQTSRLDAKIEATNSQVSAIQADIAELKANVQFIKDYIVNK